MGATNVAKVFANWRHLSHREARALAFMANMALDTDKPPRYFGGWEAVASALGLDCEGKRASAERVSMQVFASLREAGAIVSSGQARMRVRAEYAITLDLDFTFQSKGSGRDVTWTQVPRSLNAPFMQEPERDIQALPNETFRQVPERNVRNSLNDPFMPRSTEEPHGGVPEEKQGGIQIANAFSLTNARADELAALDEGLSFEDQRSRQLAALEKLPNYKEREAS